MRADLRLCQIRSGQMKKDPPRSESDHLKVHISEIITALQVTAMLLPSTVNIARLVRITSLLLQAVSKQQVLHSAQQYSDRHSC